MIYHRVNPTYLIFIITAFIVCSSHDALADGSERRMSPQAKPVRVKSKDFKPDPVDETLPYDAKAQLDIYGGKRAVNTARPLLEIGRPLLQLGEYSPGLPLSLVVFGDIQTGFGLNVTPNGSEQVFGLRANLDIDFKITSTERIHALIRPLDTANQPSQIKKIKIDNPKEEDEGRGIVHIFQQCIDKKLNPEGCNALEAFDELFANLFFEAELGGIPFALGKIPHLTQNGIWLEDAYVGGAFSLAARNSPSFDLSNYDLTFFAAALGMDDRVFGGAAKNGNDASFIATAFYIERLGLYIEGGYGFVLDRGADSKRALFSQDPRFDKQDFEGNLSYHNFTLAVTQRFGAFISNSVRLIGNLGQGQQNIIGGDQDGTLLQTANGFALLIENSLITSSPLTLVPYFNFFVGIDSPQALSRQFGLLRNTGILFENNAITNQQSLFDNPDDSVGGAIGVEYLFNIDQQIVFEVGGSASICRDLDGEGLLGNPCRRGSFAGLAVRDQAGAGLRYQLPFELLRRAWIFRADVSAGRLFQDDGANDDFFSARVELRRKF